MGFELGLFLKGWHVIFAILWAGGGLFRAMQLLRYRFNEAARDSFLHQSWQGPYMGITALGTFGFGLATLLRGEYGFEELGGGFFFFHGALGLGTLAFVVGFAGHMPVEMKLGKVLAAKAAGDYDEHRYFRLTKLTYVLTVLSSLMLLAAMVGMTMFRAFY